MCIRDSGYTDEAALAAIEPSSTVVFVMNHRSNMDYVLVSFLAAERVALSYAVGEWARIWPLQGLIRAMVRISCGATRAIRSTAWCCSATCRWRPKAAFRRRC